MDDNLLADLGQLPWQAPLDIQAVNVDDEAEALLPLDDRPIQDQGPAGPVPRLQPYVPLPPHWPVYAEMDYLGVEDEINEEWDAQQAEDERDSEDLDDEEPLLEGPADVSLATKHHGHPITSDSRLLRHINPSAPQIATIGMQGTSAMPDAAPPLFGPILEPHTPRSHQ